MGEDEEDDDFGGQDDDDEDSGLKEWYHTNQSQILALIIKIRGKLVANTRKTIITLLINDVHYRDIVSELYVKDVNSVNDFEWTKQLRFY